jgi:hypothetical protein
MPAAGAETTIEQVAYELRKGRNTWIYGGRLLAGPPIHASCAHHKRLTPCGLRLSIYSDSVACIRGLDLANDL